MSSTAPNCELAPATIASLQRAALAANLHFTAELLNAASFAMRVELDLSNQSVNLMQGQARTSKELRKQGVFVSASGVRSIWLRHDLANFEARLKALEAIVAADGGILTEAQVQALERKSTMTRPVERSRPHIRAIWDHRIRSMSVR